MRKENALKTLCKVQSSQEQLTRALLFLAIGYCAASMCQNDPLFHPQHVEMDSHKSVQRKRWSRGLSALSLMWPCCGCQPGLLALRQASGRQFRGIWAASIHSLHPLPHWSVALRVGAGLMHLTPAVH